MYCLRLLGGVSIEGERGPLAGPIAQRRRLALLALLAAAPTGAASRERVATILFPEADAARARKGVADALHAIRRTLGRDAVFAVGDDLRLNPSVIRSDVAEFEVARAAGDVERACVLYQGPFLDGFFVSDAPEFERWTEDVRQKLARSFGDLLETTANVAESRGELGRAVDAWGRLAQHDPYNSRVALRLCQVLEKHGDPAGALRAASMHAERLRHDLGVEPGPEVAAQLSGPEGSSSGGPGVRAMFSGRPNFGQTVPLPVPAASSSSTPDPRRASERSRRAAVGALLLILAFATIAWWGAIGGASVLAPFSPTERASHADSTARELYALGRLAWSKRTAEGLDEAVGYFRAAIARAPTDARAHAALADAYVMLGYLGFRPASAMFPKGKAAALQALTLDSTIAEAYAPLGEALMWERRWDEAEQAFREAIRRDPRNATAHQWYATMLMPLGRLDEAVEHSRHASALDPLSRQINNMHGMLLHYAGMSEEALAHYRRFVEAEPDTQWVRENPWLLSNMARVYTARGLHDEAIRALERALAAVPRHPRARYDLASTYVAMGQPDRAMATFAAADTANEQYAFFRASLFAELREPDSAFSWLDRVEEWGPSPMSVLRLDPRLEPIRTDPRYGHLLARLGLIAHATRSLR